MQLQMGVDFNDYNTEKEIGPTDINAEERWYKDRKTDRETV